MSLQLSGGPDRDESFSVLLDRVKKGDEGAKELLFARLGEMCNERGRLRRLARRALGRRDRARRLVDSQDLVQTALHAGLVDLCQFRGSTEKELMAWLSKILHHKLHHIVRRKRSWAGLDYVSDEEMPRKEGSEVMPVAKLIRIERRHRLREAIEQLPADQRQVLDLRLQGHRSPEIAKLLGVNPGAVRKRGSRAVARLREVLLDQSPSGL